MSPPNNETWEVEYWDEYLHTFGPAAYIAARLQQHPPNLERIATWSSQSASPRARA